MFVNTKNVHVTLNNFERQGVLVLRGKDKGVISNAKITDEIDN